MQKINAIDAGNFCQEQVNASFFSILFNTVMEATMSTRSEIEEAIQLMQEMVCACMCSYHVVDVY